MGLEKWVEWRFLTGTWNIHETYIFLLTQSIKPLYDEFIERIITNVCIFIIDIGEVAWVVNLYAQKDPYKNQ